MSGLHWKKWEKFKFTKTICNIKDIDFDFRRDIIFKILVLSENSPEIWKEFSHPKVKRSKWRASHLRRIYKSISKHGYRYPYPSRGTRDIPLTAVIRDQKYYVLNGSSRLASIIVTGIDEFPMRVVEFDNVSFDELQQRHKERFGESGIYIKNLLSTRKEEIEKWLKDRAK